MSRASTVGARLRKNTSLMVTGKLTGAALSVGALAVATNALTATEFGTLVLLHALVLFFTEVATFEAWLAVVRYGADRLERQDLPGFGRVVRFGVALDIISALLAFLLSVAVVLVARRWFEPLAQLPIALVLGYLSLILFKQVSTSQGILRLFDHFGRLAALALVIPGIRLAGGLLVAKMGWGFTGFLIVFFAASWLFYVVQPLMAWHALGVRELRHVVRGPLTVKAPERDAWRFVTLANLETGLAVGATQLPLLLAGATLGAASTGVFKVAQEMASVLVKGTKLVDRVVYPEFAALIARGEGGEVIGLTLKTSAALLVTGLALAGLFWLVGPEPLGALFGERYAQAAGVAAILLLAAALAGAVAPLFPAFYATGHPNKPLWGRAAAVSALVISFWPLTAAFGIHGAAGAVLCGSVVLIAASIALAVRHPWHEAASQPCAGQADLSASRTAGAMSPTEAERSGCPGQPASGLSVPSKLGAPSYRGRA